MTFNRVRKSILYNFYRNKENLRCKIEEQVAYEEKAFRNVEKVVLADSVSKEDLEVVVSRIFGL